MISDADRQDQWNYSVQFFLFFFDLFETPPPSFRPADIPKGISEDRPCLQSTTTHVRVDLTGGIQTEKAPECRPTDTPEQSQSAGPSRQQGGERQVKRRDQTGDGG